MRVFQFAVAAILLVLRFPAEAQQPTKMPRIGFLIVDSPSAASTRVEAFTKGLQELGYVGGKNITLESRYAEGKADRLPQLASELVRLKIDVLVTGGGNQVAMAAMKATGTIPIVMTNVADPVGSGFVASLARPGGNVPGLTSVTYDLSGKRLELIKETLPRLGRIAVLYDPSDRAKVVEFKEMQAAAGSRRSAHRAANNGNQQSSKTNCRSRGRYPSGGALSGPGICRYRWPDVLWSHLR